jgi:glutathione S-transferase
MIELHHLNESRSRRITWLLEELGVEYTVINYQRDASTRLAPPELTAVHPLGKAPVLRDGHHTIIESGAIVDYLVRHYGKGSFAPAADSTDYEQYVQLMHYAEGSAALPLLLKLYVGRLGDAGAPLSPRIESEIANHMGWLDQLLGDRPYFIGDRLSGADVQLSFIAQVAVRMQGAAAFPHLTAFAARMEARPAYQRAMKKHGV